MAEALPDSLRDRRNVIQHGERGMVEGLASGAVTQMQFTSWVEKHSESAR